MSRTELLLTVDVEEWAQSSWDRELPITDASARQCARLLEVLAEFRSARATFFVLGKFAERHPSLVAEIDRAGHEVACHGYGHVEIFRMNRKTFAEDVRASTDLVGAACGARPIGFRAPDFSIVGESLWSLDVLCENGYEYDSSIFPIRKRRYGIEGWPPVPTRLTVPSGAQIVELPIATVSAGRWRLPAGGGGYARLLPGSVLQAALQRSARETRVPPMFYCHPYELDHDELRALPFPVPLRVRLHQGAGRKGTERKLRRLLTAFRCISAKDALHSFAELPTVDTGRFVLSMKVDRPPALR